MTGFSITACSALQSNGELNIGTSETTTSINIGTDTSTRLIDIGNSFNTLNIIGQITFNTSESPSEFTPITSNQYGGAQWATTIKANSIQSTSANVSANTTSLFNNIVTGALSIGTSLTTGALRIGTALTTGLLTIGATGPVSIAPRQPTNTYVDIGSTGSQARSGLRLFQPLTMNYGTNWSAPSTNQIGQRIDGAGGAGDSYNFPLTVRNMSLGPGTYYITGNVIYNYATVWNITSISFTNNAQNYACSVFGSNGSGNWGVNLSLCWTVSGNTTTNVYLVVQSNTYSTIGAVVFNATRIG
jgi:hypothetical protein